MLDIKIILTYGAAIIVAYLFGSIPWSLIIGKVFYNTDIRDFGSGNLGATNAGRVLGKKAGLAAALLDIFKAFIVVVAISFINKDLAAISGLFASIGHSFPIFANFRGGKSVATNYGYIIASSIFITNNFLIQALLPILILIAIALIFKMVSLASIISLITASLIALSQPNKLVSVGIVLISIFSIWRHKDNIKRILKNEEKKVEFLSKWSSSMNLLKLA